MFIGKFRKYSEKNLLKKMVYSILGDVAIPTTYRLMPAIKWIKEREFSSILDIGISHGVLLFHLAEIFPESKLLGIDIEPDFISECNIIIKSNLAKYKNVQLLKHDMQKPLPIIGKYNLVTIFDVVEHIAELDSLFNNIFNILVEDGVLIIGVPYYQDGGIPQKEEKTNLHVDHVDHEWKGFSLKSLERVSKRNRFKIIANLSQIGFFARIALFLFYKLSIRKKDKNITEVTPQ